MGKVFVKGPTESPNDLLAKQTAAVAPSMSQKIRRRGADFGRTVRDELKELGSVAGPAVGEYLATRDVAGAGQKVADFAGNVVGQRYGAKDGGKFVGDLFHIPFALMFGRKPATPQEQEYAKILAREQATQQRQNEGLLGRFQNLAQRQGADVAGLTPYKDSQSLAEFEEYAREEFPGMSLNEVANMLGQQFTNLQALDLRRRATGKEGVEGFGPANRANQTIAVSNAAATGAQEPPSAPLTPFRVKDVLDPNNPEKQLLDTLTGADEQEQAPLPNTPMPSTKPTKVTPVADKEAIANSGALSEDQNDGKNQIDQVEAAAHLHNKETGMNHEPESTNLALEEQKNIPSLNNATPLRSPAPLLQPATPALLNLPPEDAGPFSPPKVTPKTSTSEPDDDWWRKQDML